MSVKIKSVILASAISLVSLLSQAADVEFLPSDAGKKLNLPFSEAVRVDSTLYLSGQIGNIPGTTNLAKGGIEGETRQTMNNIQAVLARNNASLEDIVKCTVFLADIAEWPAFNVVYKEFFSAPYPARSALAAAGLALNARVEVECIAVIKADGDK